jgi:hypothetical protein
LYFTDREAEARELYFENGGKTIEEHAVEKILAGEIDPLDAEKKLGPSG